MKRITHKKQQQSDALAYAGFFQWECHNIACMPWSLPRQAWIADMKGGGDSALFPLVLGGQFSIFRHGIGVFIVLYLPLWQAKKRGKRALDPKGGGGPPPPLHTRLIRCMDLIWVLRYLWGHALKEAWLMLEARHTIISHLILIM